MADAASTDTPAIRGGASELLPVSLAERTFREHVAGADFQRGVASSRWRLIQATWPHALIAVRAAPRVNAPEEYVLRFELTNYPVQAPQGTAWDLERNEVLGAIGRPRGERVGKAFRTDWEGGSALYLPCDRMAMSGHPGWATWRWDSSCDITFYLRLVSEMLNDEDYVGV